MEETWSNEKCLELIDVYEKHPDLWDSKHPLYYNKKNRNESWQKLAIHFDTDIMGIKRKMFSLLGSFRIQKAKGREIIGEGPNKKEVYVSKWFAFEKMLFLLDEKDQQQGMGSEEYDVTYDTLEIKSESNSVEFYDNPATQNDINDTSSLISRHISIKESIPAQIPANISLTDGSLFLDVNNEYCENNFGQPNESTQYEIGINNSKQEENCRKRKAIEVNQDDQNCKKIQIAKVQQKNNDYLIECEADTSPIPNSIQIFGRYIASKLNSYSSKTKAIAEHAINNVLFEADMGWYENASPKR